MSSRGEERNHSHAAPRGETQRNTRLRRENNLLKRFHSQQSTAILMSYLEAIQLIVPVHKQLRLVPVNPDQDHVLGPVLHVAAHQFVGGSICEELEEEDERSHVTFHRDQEEYPQPLRTAPRCRSKTISYQLSGPTVQTPCSSRLHEISNVSFSSTFSRHHVSLRTFTVCQSIRHSHRHPV